MKRIVILGIMSAMLLVLSGCGSYELATGAYYPNGYYYYYGYPRYYYPPMYYHAPPPPPRHHHGPRR